MKGNGDAIWISESAISLAKWMIADCYIAKIISSSDEALNVLFLEKLWDYIVIMRT